MSGKIGPGAMCWMNSKCGIPVNVGIIVEVIELASIEDGQNVWHIHSKDPMLCFHISAGYLRTYRTCCACEEIALTLIAGPGSELDETTVREHDTSDML